MKKRRMAGLAIVIVLAGGCTALNPQQAARQQAESYYNRPYAQLTAEEKMRLENHLTRQDNTAWRTNAQVAGGVGRLLQGIGVLIFSVR